MKEFIGEERRITQRLMHYWEGKRGARLMPEIGDISGSDLGELWDYSFIAEVSPLTPSHQITYAGQAIHPFFKENEDSEVSLNTLGPKFSEECKKLIHRVKPIIGEGTIVSNGVAYKYRQILLPLGKDKKVQAIFGGMRFLRMVQDRPVTSSLEVEAGLLLGYKAEFQAPRAPVY